MKDLPEADWKLLSLMNDTLLRRASRTAIEHVNRFVIGPDDDPHKVYLALCGALQNEADRIAPCSTT